MHLYIILHVDSQLFDDDELVSYLRYFHAHYLVIIDRYAFLLLKRAGGRVFPSHFITD